MSTLEILKEQLKQRISNSADEKLLQKILKLVGEEEAPLKLTDEQKRRILKGRKEIAEGKGISNEEAKRRTAEWLKTKK